MAKAALGLWHKREKFFEQAVVYYRKALELDPASDETYYNLGNALAAMENYPDAAEVYLQALKLNSEHIDARNNLAVSYRRMGFLAKAEEQLIILGRLKREKNP